jgi:uncharacterized DUF497 family protein
VASITRRSRFKFIAEQRQAIVAEIKADPDHSAAEERMLTFGVSHKGQLLVVVHTKRKRAVRIISARKATKHER